MLFKDGMSILKGEVLFFVLYVFFCYGYFLDIIDVWIRIKILEWRMEIWRVRVLNFFVGLLLILWFYLMILIIMTDSIISLLILSDNSGIN